MTTSTMQRKMAMTVAMIATALAFAPGARAQEEEAQKKINYRCENAKARAEAWEYACLYRCERRSARRDASERDAFFTTCSERCHTRCDDKKRLIESGPACQAEVPAPGPERCAARHLAALSQLNLCHAFCPEMPAAPVEEGAPLPRAAQCRANCDERHAARRTKLDASEVCMNGGAPVCYYQ